MRPEQLGLDVNAFLILAVRFGSSIASNYLTLLLTLVHCRTKNRTDNHAKVLHQSKSNLQRLANSVKQFQLTLHERVQEVERSLDQIEMVSFCVNQKLCYWYTNNEIIFETFGSMIALMRYF